MRILIIEDDLVLARGMAFMLEKEGYKVSRAGTGEEGRRLVKELRPSLVLMDWNLPDRDGLELCREIKRSEQVPVLMITARDMEIDQVMCLEYGADDYMAKPFSLAVLKARITALLRRCGKAVRREELLVSGGISMDTACMKAFKNGSEVELSLTEFRLLRYFMENKNQVLMKEQILAHVWDSTGAYVEENTLSVNIRRLRMKLEDDPSNPAYMKTIHGMGYLWEERDE